MPTGTCHEERRMGQHPAQKVIAAAQSASVVFSAVPATGEGFYNRIKQCRRVERATIRLPPITLSCGCAFVSPRALGGAYPSSRERSSWRLGVTQFQVW